MSAATQPPSSSSSSSSSPSSSPPPERTADGRHVVIDGRRWRAGDPALPERLERDLVGELMSARRAVGAATRAGDDDAEAGARRRVHDAKVALGERGDPWWDRTAEGTRARIDAAIRALLRARDPDASICPGEAARVVDGEAWRDLMDAVRDRAAELAGDDEIVATRGDVTVDARSRGGPIRLRRGPRFGEVAS